HIHTVKTTSVDLGGCRAKWLPTFEGNAAGVV
ncbi:hypothetical protein M2432_005696, partial [Mycobacterium sp. OTB74]|nr:hypothetical protein [Mycobacterium sp. OTB74]